MQKDETDTLKQLCELLALGILRLRKKDLNKRT